MLLRSRCDFLVTRSPNFNNYEFKLIPSQSSPVEEHKAEEVVVAAQEVTQDPGRVARRDLIG